MERRAEEIDMERIAIVEVDVRVAATGMRASRLIGADVYNDGMSISARLTIS